MPSYLTDDGDAQGDARRSIARVDRTRRSSSLQSVRLESMPVQGDTFTTAADARAFRISPPWCAHGFRHHAGAEHGAQPAHCMHSSTEETRNAPKAPIFTRQLHYIEPQLAYTVQPASSVHAANTESFSVCAATRKAPAPRARHLHPLRGRHTRADWPGEPCIRGRASPFARDLCNIRVHRHGH